MEFAKWYFQIHSKPEKSPISRYESLKQVEKATGRTPPGLQAPPISDLCINAWEIFCKMRKVSYSEIAHYCQLTNDYLEPWEVNLIIGFDIARNEQWQKQQS